MPAITTMSGGTRPHGGTLLESAEKLERVVESGGHITLIPNDVVFGVHVDRPGPIFGGADRE